MAPRKPWNLSRSFQGFTLLEILVVISIIAVLAAILIPVFIGARENGRRTACVSNISQTWKSVRMYVEDYDGAWPGLPAWQFWLRDHPELPLCPAIEARRKEFPNPPQGVPGYAYSGGLVAYHETIFGEPSVVRDEHIRFPATTVSLCEEAPGRLTTIGPDPFFDVAPYPYGQEEGWKRHRGGANYAFCDGHVKWYLPEAVGYNNGSGNDGTKPTFALGPPPPL